MKITSISPDGVTSKSLSELSDSEQLEIEQALEQNNFAICCNTCLVEISQGFYCDRHAPQLPIHDECGKTYWGRFCQNCFTGFILTTPSGERYLERK